MPDIAYLVIPPSEKRLYELNAELRDRLIDIGLVKGPQPLYADEAFRDYLRNLTEVVEELGDDMRARARTSVDEWLGYLRRHFGCAPLLPKRLFSP